MNDVRKAVDRLKSLLKTKKGPNVEEYISDLTLTVSLLELLTPSLEEFKTLSGLLREQLQPLYLAHLQATLNYAIAVLKFLHTEKIIFFLQRCDPGRANLWEGPASSVISGILDYLERHQTKKPRESVASAVYPTICALYFTNGPSLLSSYDGNLLLNVYMLLGETVASPGADVSQLRDHIGSRRLGRTISEMRNYLALESIINLLGNLMPPSRHGKEMRSKFLQEVFEEPIFKGSKRILQALEIINRDWTITAMKIIHTLAESDSRFPQPFQAFHFQVGSSSMMIADPIFVDNKSFIASLDQDGSVESLVIPFTTVRGITISALNGIEMKVELRINKAPLLGNNPMSLPQRENHSVSFSISKTSINTFGKVMKERNLKMERLAQRKLSQAPGELLPEIMTTEDDQKWQEKAAKLTNMAKHGDTSWAQLGHASSSNLDDHQSPRAFVDVPSDKVPNTVFLDPDGNFSIYPLRDLAHPQTKIMSNNCSPRNDQQNASEDEELPLQPKQAPKSKIKITVISDDEDVENPPNPKVEVETSKQKIVETEKKPFTAQSTKALKTDDISSRHANKLTDSRQPRAENENDSRKPDGSKKRTLRDDVSDMEVPTTKRIRLDIVPQSHPKQRPARFSRKSKQVSAASPASGNSGGFDVDFDEIPKAEQGRPQARARGMKGKNGKAAPRPRPLTRNKHKGQNDGKEAMQQKANMEVQDAERTLVEAEPLESPEIKAETGRTTKDTNPQSVGGNKSANTRSKKSNKAPWEMQDFASVKIEMTEEVTVSFDPIDDMSPKIEPSSDVNGTERHKTPLHDQDIPGSKHVNFAEPSKSETMESSEPPLSPPVPSQPAQVWIDLTNSPDLVETRKPPPLKRTIRKAPSFDTRRNESIEEPAVRSVHQDQSLHGARIGKTHRKVEKFPLLPIPSDATESFSSTSPPARDTRSTKIRKFSSPIRARRHPPYSGKLHSARKSPRVSERHSEEEDVLPREIPKEQKSEERKSGSLSSRKLRWSEDDPDLRIAAVLGEINKVLVGNIQKRFTGMSSDLQRTKRELRAQVAEELGKMNNELFKQYNCLVDLYEEFVSRTTKLANALDVFEKATADGVQGYRDMLKDFKRNSLHNQLTMDLVKESTLAEIKKHSKLNIEI